MFSFIFVEDIVKYKNIVVEKSQMSYEMVVTSRQSVTYSLFVPQCFGRI